MEQVDQAFVTLATDDNYAVGALVLGCSLKRVQTINKLVVLITSGVSESLRSKLTRVFDLLVEVNPMDSEDEANLALMVRPELGITFTKLHCWKLTQFSKCVFLDADTLVLQNCDELFEREELSAVPDVGWPDCFNSGVFVFKPSDETYKELIQMAVEKGSFDGGDQGLLNTYFSNWSTNDISTHLSFIYNMNTGTSYTYLPAFKQFGKNVKIVHFLGSSKPWMHKFDEKTGSVEQLDNCQHLQEHLQIWWDIYVNDVSQIDESDPEGLSYSMSKVDIGTPESSVPSEISSPEFPDDANRKLSWEQGQIDYMGKDSFDNIQRKLDEAINNNVTALT